MVLVPLVLLPIVSPVLLSLPPVHLVLMVNLFPQMIVLLVIQKVLPMVGIVPHVLELVPFPVLLLLLLFVSLVELVIMVL